jgi:hypothetical protein
MAFEPFLKQRMEKLTRVLVIHKLLLSRNERKPIFLRSDLRKKAKLSFESQNDFWRK